MCLAMFTGRIAQYINEPLLLSMPPSPPLHTLFDFEKRRKKYFTGIFSLLGTTGTYDSSVPIFIYINYGTILQNAW